VTTEEQPAEKTEAEEEADAEETGFETVAAGNVIGLLSTKRALGVLTHMGQALAQAAINRQDPKDVAVKLKDHAFKRQVGSYQFEVFVSDDYNGKEFVRPTEKRPTGTGWRWPPSLHLLYIFYT
jgi:hypothetical protein